MIGSTIYELEAKMPSKNFDKNGEIISKWVPVYGQLKNKHFQYTFHLDESVRGAFSQVISN
jgi:deoxyribodipyrimidine photolyase